MKNHLHSADMQGLAGDLNRISSLGDRRMFDYVLSRLLNPLNSLGGNPLGEGRSGYFPQSDCKVVYLSGDRSTGVNFEISAGRHRSVHVRLAGNTPAAEIHEAA